MANRTALPQHYRGTNANRSGATWSRGTSAVDNRSRPSVAITASHSPPASPGASGCHCTAHHHPSSRSRLICRRRSRNPHRSKSSCPAVPASGSGPAAMADAGDCARRAGAAAELSLRVSSTPSPSHEPTGLAPAALGRGQRHGRQTSGWGQSRMHPFFDGSGVDGVLASD